MNTVDLCEIGQIHVLAGSNRVSVMPNIPFDEDVCNFLNHVSQTLRNDKQAKQYPDVISFAFWCRKANIAKERKAREGNITNRLGRGLAFHVAPSNVPVNFAFTFAFSLLAGNSTVVRVPTKEFEQVDIINHAFEQAFVDFPAFAQKCAVIRYPVTSNATEVLSSMADVRVIWGGDNTVHTIRALNSKPRCVDIAFADRYSIALIHADAIMESSDKKLERLANGFYNDTYLMDQNACSSPQTILWIGESNVIADAQNRFWEAVGKEARTRYNLQAAIAVDKHIQLAADCVQDKISGFKETDGFLTTAEIHDEMPLSTNNRGVGGYFYEKHIESISAIAEQLNEKYQTLVQFGFDSNELRDELISAGCTGIDRIAPIGSALDIGLIWDGYDLIDAMSRIVNVQS